MKFKTAFIFIFCLFSNILFAHTINYDKAILRHWSIVSENKTIDGSFFMLKDSQVFIDDANDNIIKVPLNSLSKEDQAFALKKAAWIKDLNAKLRIQETNQVKKNNVFDYRYLIVAFILLIVGWYFFSVDDKKKLKFLVPILITGIAITMFSFTGSVLKLMSSTTDPLFVDSAFTPFKPNVYTHWDSTYFYVESIGIPTTHPMMAGIINWQQQVPIPQCYIGNNPWSIPLKPVIAANPVPVNPNHFIRGAVAVAVNGIAIFNPYTNTGVDAYLTGQLDQWGGHCGRADDYHYHIAPLQLYNNTSSTLPIAFALDGFAVYGNYEPDGALMQPLDANHGHYGSNGVYHYHGTANAPYMIGNMVGVVTEDTTHQIIPQAHANPIRPAGTPLNGAVITGCQPNATNNGYTLTYSLSGNTDSIVYSWNTSGQYVFNFYTATGSSTQTYNGFIPCTVPTLINDVQPGSNDVMIYPNPTQNGFSIQLSDAIQRNDFIETSIYDLRGKLVYNSKIYQQDISVSNLARGVYVFKIQLKENQIAKKLVVQ